MPDAALHVRLASIRFIFSKFLFAEQLKHDKLACGNTIQYTEATSFIVDV